jgi:hypothetical protein
MTLLRTYFRFESVVYLGSIVLSVALPCPYLIHPRAFARHFLRNFRFFPFISQIQIFKLSNFLEIREPRVKYDLDAGSFFKVCLVPPGGPPGFLAAGFGRINSNETVHLPVDCNRSTPWSFRSVDVRQQHIKFDLTSVRLLRGAVVVRRVTGDGSTAGLEGRDSFTSPCLPVVHDRLPPVALEYKFPLPSAFCILVLSFSSSFSLNSYFSLLEVHTNLVFPHHVRHKGAPNGCLHGV